MKITLKELILTGVFTAFTAVMAQIRFVVPFLPVPVTMQIFAICLTAVILGSKCGALSQITYVLLGLLGVPVFSGFHSGPGVILGPAGGYIISFPAVAFIAGYIAEHLKKLSIPGLAAAMAAGLLVCYSAGSLWLGIVSKLDFMKAIVLGAGWYLPLDAIKIIFAAIIGYRIRISAIHAGLTLPS
jgi:biotin transport system substrate-specific component